MNKILAELDSKEEFVEHCLKLDSLPAVPPYWKRMRKMNQRGPALVGTLAEPSALRPEEFDRMRSNSSVVLDCRSPEAFTAHIPGAINVGLGSSFATWAGTVLPEGAPVLLVLESEPELWDACWQLLRIGYDLPKGWLAGGMRAWRSAAKPVEVLAQWTVWQLREGLEQESDLVVLDVRQPAEWKAGHIQGAVYITGAELPAKINDVPKDRPVATVCGSGHRSSIAASLLLRNGNRRVVNVLGGMSAWKKAGFETVKADG
jgi:hydroxyacylglutathione hydrolase